MSAWIRAGVVAAACWASSGHGQVYKWTDAQGKVHYGDRKNGAGARPQELKIRLPPTAPPGATPPAAAWIPQPKASEVRWPEPPAPEPPPRSQSGGKENGSDASRCALAQDVLEGKLRHANGASIDAHDRDIATADVKRFCR